MSQRRLTHYRAIWYLDYLGYNLSAAVSVGIIALAGVVMLVYLDEAYERRVREDRMTTFLDLREVIMEGAVQRVRLKVMTVTAVMGGLLSIMWATGTDADMMKRIVALMIGGMASSTILTLIVIPILYSMWRRVQLRSVIPVLYRRECCGQETMHKSRYKCASHECEEIQRGDTEGQHIEKPPFCFLSGQLTRLCTHCHALDAAS